MLREIYINNFVLIEELRLDLVSGLNILTGETGAGKSIIIDALGLVIGDRVTNDFVKDSSRKAIVEAVFDVSDNHDARIFLMEKGLLEEEGLLILSREISPGGRSTARVNGRSVTVSTLRNLAVYLLDMHLQHDHLSILRSEMYLKYVDNFSAGSVDILPQLQKNYEELREKQQEFDELQVDEKNKMQKIDFLSYQIDEIEDARLSLGEEEELSALSRRIQNSRKLLESSERVLQLLYEGQEGRNAYDLISLAVDTCTDLHEEEFFSGLQKQLEEIYYIMQDKVGEITTYRDSLDFEPGVQDEVEDRLYIINKLKKKYGNSIEEILDYLEKASDEKKMLDNSQEQLELLKTEIEALRTKYYKKAAELNKIRNHGAIVLQDKVNRELQELNMPGTQFAVSVEPECKEGPDGMDRVEFMFSANPGEPLRPLSRVASGGEISRFVLALKKALADVYNVPTLIFDEIDIGVGGTSLTAMAQKIRELADTHQLILVTHSPQVASYAQRHYLIEKQMNEGKTSTLVKALDENEKVKEIARMLAGDNYSELSLEHAREMYTKGQA